MNKFDFCKQNGLHYSDNFYNDGYLCAGCEGTSIEQDCPMMEGAEGYTEWCEGFNDCNEYWRKRLLK